MQIDISKQILICIYYCLYHKKRYIKILLDK